MKSVACALPLLFAAVPAALANPDLLLEQLIQDPDPQLGYTHSRMEDGTLVFQSPAGLEVYQRDPVTGLCVSTQPAVPLPAAYGQIALANGLVVFAAAGKRVCVIERDQAGVYAITDELTDPGLLAGGLFAQSVDTDGSRIVVGCTSATLNVAHAYVFERDAAGTWQPALIVAPSEDNGLLADFARSVAIEGDFVAVGAPYAKVGPGEGAVHVYRRQAFGDWTLTQTLSDAQGQFGDRFGHCLDLDQGTLIVAGIYVQEYGAVFVYQQDPTNGQFAPHPTTWRLLPPSGDFNAGQSGFGLSLNIDGDLLAVGSPYGNATPGGVQGVVYLFARDQAGAWAAPDLLPRVFASPVPGDVSDQFGSTVDLDGSFLTVTRAAFGDGGAGCVHVFSPPFAQPDAYHLHPDPQAKFTGLAIGTLSNVQSVVGPGGLLLDWDIPMAPAAWTNDPAQLLSGGGQQLRVVEKPDEALLAPALPIYPQPFVWYPDGSFLLIPAAGFTGLIEWQYAWFVGELQLTEPVKVVVIVGDPRRRGELPPLRR